MKDVSTEEVHKFALQNLSYLKQQIFDKNDKVKESIFVKWNKVIKAPPVKISKDFWEKIFVIYEVVAMFELSKDRDSSSFVENIDLHIEPIYIELAKSKALRSRILGKWYNYELNKVEYELEDGNFVTIDGILRQPVVDTIWKILPEFVYLLYNLGEYRQNKLITLQDED